MSRFGPTMLKAAALALGASSAALLVVWLRLPLSELRRDGMMSVVLNSQAPASQKAVVFVSLGVFPPLMVIVGASVSRSLWRMSKLLLPGRCPQCGYDLRATPDRCPECGEMTKTQ